MASIRLKNIEKRFGNGHLAVASCNLEINAGEFLVLVGPSGCGKSTTLRMVAGLEEATAGDIFIGEQRVNDISPGKRDIAMVFQNYALYPHMTVRQNLSFGLKMQKVSRSEIQQRVDEAAGILSIEELLDRRPHQLSGGQRQRVALGRAIVRKPAAFLFDEPLSNLDAKLRTEMRAELARLHQKLGTTTIYVTHDQTEAMTLGQRIVVMNDGVIQQIDEPLVLYQQPANRFVASFIGSPPMNLLDGKIEDNQFKLADLQISLPNSLKIENQSLTLGFRPEDISTGKTDLRLAEVVLDVVEQLGSEIIAYFEIAGQQLIGKFPGNSDLRVGQQVSLFLNPAKLHFFSGSTQENLRLVAAGSNSAGSKKAAADV